MSSNLVHIQVKESFFVFIVVVDFTFDTVVAVFVVRFLFRNFRHERLKL